MVFLIIILSVLLIVLYSCLVIGKREDEAIEKYFRDHPSSGKS